MKIKNIYKKCLHIITRLHKIKFLCPICGYYGPFKPQSCNVVFASHVMEHIHDDHSAIKEI